MIGRMLDVIDGSRDVRISTSVVIDTALDDAVRRVQAPALLQDELHFDYEEDVVGRLSDVIIARRALDDAASFLG